MRIERLLPVARAALGLSVLVLVALAWRAVSWTPLAAPSARPELVLPEPPEPQRVAEAAISLAAETDPFRADRSARPSRYRLPGDVEPAADSVDVELEAPEVVTLLGTVVLPEGRGVAMLQYGEDAPRLVRVGEKIGTLTLRMVRPGLASLADTDGSVIDVSVARPRY